ncbi:unnamed protein product, partial [marine sediment metagenome]
YKGALIQLGYSIISLIEATDENSFMAKFIEKRGEGIQHIGVEVDNIEEFVKQLESKGIRVDKEDMKNENFQEALETRLIPMPPHHHLTGGKVHVPCPAALEKP